MIPHASDAPCATTTSAAPATPTGKSLQSQCLLPLGLWDLLPLGPAPAELHLYRCEAQLDQRRPRISSPRSMVRSAAGSFHRSCQDYVVTASTRTREGEVPAWLQLTLSARRGPNAPTVSTWSGRLMMEAQLHHSAALVQICRRLAPRSLQALKARHLNQQAWYSAATPRAPRLRPLTGASLLRPQSPSPPRLAPALVHSRW